MWEDATGLVVVLTLPRTAANEACTDNDELLISIEWLNGLQLIGIRRALFSFYHTQLTCNLRSVCRLFPVDIANYYITE